MANRRNAGRCRRGEPVTPPLIADKHAEQRVQALVGNSPLAVIEWDFQHRIVQWTGNAPQMFGWSASEVAGKRVDEWRFVYEGDWDQVHQAMDAMERGQNFVCRNRNYRRDGSLIHCEWYNSVLLDEAGAYCGGLSLVLDTTDRERVAEALRVSEKKYREIVETAPVAIFLSTVQGRFLNVNSRLATMLGYDSAAEIIAAVDNIGEQLFLTPGLRSAVVQRAMTSNGFVPAEVEYRRRDGSVCIANLHIRAVRDQAGRTICLEGFAEDITERKRAEERLNASEERFRSAFEKSAVAMALTGPDAQFLKVNAALCRMLELEESALVGHSVYEFTHPDDIELNQKAVKAFAESGTSFRIQKRYIGAEGRVIWADVSSAAVRDSQGRPRYMVTHIQDITERKQAEEALQGAYGQMERRVEERTAELSAANERLQELDRLKSQFLASMSHELRTPLNSIIGFTSLLSRGVSGPVSDEQKKQLEIVQSSARHLLTLINDLLDVSRIEAGRADIERKPFDFVHVLNEVTQSLTPMAGRKGLDLIIETSAPAIPMMGDRKRTLQILLNLVNNAIKFTNKGHVKITTAVQKRMLSVAVADTGIGIKAEHIGMLFEAFRQVDGSAKRVYEGTGLGLYLCRKLLGLMGGEISVESVYGAGSCFTYVMPLELAVEVVSWP